MRNAHLTSHLSSLLKNRNNIRQDLKNCEAPHFVIFTIPLRTVLNLLSYLRLRIQVLYLHQTTNNTAILHSAPKKKLRGYHAFL